jgi:GH15 family glucan-1,4-alpha-glucosidase
VNGGHPAFAIDRFLEETSKAVIGDGPVQDRSVVEAQLDHWEGYMHSKPVRIGNAAATQSQLDIYGELMDAVYLCDKYCRPVGSDFWRVIKKRLVEPVLDHWQDADYGIWEVRGPPRHYVYSKVMCWVCLDRGT